MTEWMNTIKRRLMFWRLPPEPHTEAEKVRVAVETAIASTLKEQRRRRRRGRWVIGLLLLYLYLLLFVSNMPSYQTIQRFFTAEHTAVIDVDGRIGANNTANADSIVSSLRDAFEEDDVAGIIVRINSRGGSQVQANIIRDEILRLRGKYPQTPVIAAITENGLAEAYMIAAATQKIYADKASTIGMFLKTRESFGATRAMQDMGIERRLLRTGEYKDLLDPYSPLRVSHVAMMEGLLARQQQQYRRTIVALRGDALHDASVLSRQRVWIGAQALTLGLIDGLASPGQIARDIIGAEKTLKYRGLPGKY